MKWVTNVHTTEAGTFARQMSEANPGRRFKVGDPRTVDEGDSRRQQATEMAGIWQEDDADSEDVHRS